MSNDPPTKAPTTKRPNSVWFTIGIILLVLGLYWWIAYLQWTFPGFKTGPLNTPWVFLGFLYWFIPWFLGTYVSLLAARGWRKITSLVVLPLGLLFVVFAIVTTVTGAEPPTPS